MDELNHIVRNHACRSLNFSGTGIRDELLSLLLSGQLQMILTTFAPGAGNKESRQRKSEEAGVVQSGSLEPGIGNKHFLLATGDTSH